MGYFAAFLLPLVYKGIPNPVGLRWLLTHGNAQMPADVEARALRIGYVVPFFYEVIVASGICLMIRHSGWPATAVGITSDGWKTATLIGALAGAAWVSLSILLLVRTRPKKEHLARNRLLKYPLTFWIPLGLVAAFVEEFWRAFCLVALAGEGSVGAISITAVAFGAAHGMPLGFLVSTTAFGISAGALFLWTHSLWATIPAHVIVNLVTPFLIRRAYSRAASDESVERT